MKFIVLLNKYIFQLNCDKIKYKKINIHEIKKNPVRICS